MTVARFVRSFVSASEIHHHQAFGVEFHHGHGRLVDDPKIVVFVEPDRVRVGEAVNPFAELTNEVALLVEFE